MSRRPKDPWFQAIGNQTGRENWQQRELGESLLGLYREWDRGALTGESFKDQMREFCRTRFRQRLNLGWPLDYQLACGTWRDFGVQDCRDILIRFRAIQRMDWCCFVGLVCPNDREENVGCDIWVLLGQNKSVYGYDREHDRLYVLCEGLHKFVEMGIRNLESFYETRFTCKYVDALRYGHELEERQVKAIEVSDNHYELEKFVNRNGGLEFETPDESPFFVMGNAEHHRLGSVIPMQVLSKLRERGYFIVGKCVKYQRVIVGSLIDRSIFCLLGAGFLLKLTDSFTAFLRRRLAALERGRPICLTPVSQEDYVAPGSQVYFSCTTEYTLPGDEDLLRCWARQVPTDPGWPLL
uniref:M28 n=1 Tax=Cardioderma bat herpesvirus TaxID=3141914 RepID=A0AAU7E1P8_9VIRU